jgi:hypothetical protein
MSIHKRDTALVFIDAQNDVLREHGISWGLVGDSVKETTHVSVVELLNARLANCKDLQTQA